MYKRGDITKEAKKIGVNTKTHFERRRKRGVVVMPRYTETEIYLLMNFDYRACKPFISHKSLNALKIKQWRLLNKTLKS